MDGGAAGLPGQFVLGLVETTTSPAPGHAQQGHRGRTARDKEPELRDAIIPVEVKTLNLISIKVFKLTF